MPVVFADWDPAESEKDLARSHWPAECEIYWADELSPSQIQEILARTEVFVGYITFDWAEIASKLKFVHVLGHGIDPLLSPPVWKILKDRGVNVARATPAAITVSEFVFMAMIALSRRLLPVHLSLSLQGDWSEKRRKARMQGSLGGELHDSTLGIVGFGGIGREIYHRAKAFGMRISVITKHPDRLQEEQLDTDFIGDFSSLDEMLSRVKYVVLALPLTETSRGLFDRRRFATMQPGSYIINVSRGTIVQEGALYAALETGRLAGAAIDVWETEETDQCKGYPSLFPFHQHNVIMTPHYSGATQESRTRAIQKVGINLERWLQGRVLLDQANLVADY